MTDLMKKENARPMISATDVNPISMMFDPVIAERVSAIAATMAKGHVTVPEHLRGNMGDCLAIVMQAASWRLNPFIVAQKTHLIQGKLGYEAQLVGAVVASMGILEGRFRFEYEGDWSKIEVAPKILKGNRGAYPERGWKQEDEQGLAVVVTGKLRGESEPRFHRTALAMVWPRNSTLWATNPQQQISYLATKQWVRKFAPDAILGVYSTDELEAESMQQVNVVAPQRDASAEIMDRARQLEQQTTVVNPEDNQESPPDDDDEQDEWPQERDGILVDIRGVPWNKELYSKGKTCNDDGTWRKRRGASKTDIDRHESRYLAKVEASGTRTDEQSAGGHDDGQSAQNEQRTVERHATEQEMRHRINQAGSCAEIEEHIASVQAHPGWDDAVKDDLLELARGHHADWTEVERQDRESQQQGQQELV